MTGAEGRPPKSGSHRALTGATPPGARPVKPVSSSRIRPAAAPSGPTAAVPRGADAGTARRAVGAPPRARAPEPFSGPEVVVSAGQEQSSTVRRRVGARGPMLAGLSLRWKIVLGMAGITLVTGVLIFIVVYSKAVGQLNDEINLKGVTLLNLLASIDDEYWHAAINSGDSARRPLRGLERKAAQYGLLDAGVADVSKGDTSVPGINLAGPVEMERMLVPEKGQTLIRDKPFKAGSGQIMSRMFVRDSAPESARRLRYYVALSLEGINEAKGSLMWAILLPVFISAMLGVGIAIWISTLITEPIKVLISDINEVSSGNLDHQTRATSRDEVGLLAATFNKMTQALKLAHTQELEAKALEHDLSIASEIQSNLVPKRMLKVPGFDVSAYYRPSKEVGGDYYDFITIDEDNEGIIVADVSGKGVPGSLVMSMARAFIRMEAERSRNTSPADTLVRANRMLAQDIKKGMFVTALYCILNKKSREIRVASAGHNPLVVWRAAENQIQLVNPSGIALGFDKGPVFERTVKEEKVALNPGDRVVMYTDGVVEAMNADNQEFGDKRFHQLVKQLGTRDSNQMLNLVIKAIDDYRGDAPQSDDITIVTLRLL